jgi:hypothetical protein
VRTAEAFGEQHVERLPDCSRARPAEQLLRRAVVLHDTMLLIHGDHAVHGRVEDAPDPRFDVVQRPVRRLALEAQTVRKPQRQQRRRNSDSTGHGHHDVGIPARQARQEG